MRSAGLRTLATRGMSEADGEILLSEAPDQTRDYKLVFVGARVNDARRHRGKRPDD